MRLNCLRSIAENRLLGGVINSESLDFFRLQFGGDVTHPVIDVVVPLPCGEGGQLCLDILPVLPRQRGGLDRSSGRQPVTAGARRDAARDVAIQYQVFRVRNKEGAASR